MPKASVRVGAEYPVPPAAVWSVVSDHEGTHAWVPKVKRVTLLKPGEPKNGMPALRRVEFRPALWSTIDERIVAYEDGRRFDYQIVAGMPGVKHHLGSIRVGPTEGGCRLDWVIEFDFAWWWGPFAGPFSATFQRALEEGLETLRGVVA